MSKATEKAVSAYKLFCLHLAGTVYETLTFQGHVQQKVIGMVQRRLKARPINPLLADEAKRLNDEAERSI